MLACAHTLLIADNSRGAIWPLANFYQGGNFDFLDNGVDTDKRVAA